jgi:hypothetical protein
MPILLPNCWTGVELHPALSHEEASRLPARQEVMDIEAKPQGSPDSGAKILNFRLKRNGEVAVEIVDCQWIERVREVDGRVAVGRWATPGIGCNLSLANCINAKIHIVVGSIEPMGRVDIGRVVTVWLKRFAGADKRDLLLGRMRMVRKDHLAANRLPDHARHGNPDLREQLVRRYFAAKRAAQPGGMDNESFWALRQNAVLGTLNGIEVIKRLFIDQDDDAG